MDRKGKSMQDFDIFDIQRKTLLLEARCYIETVIKKKDKIASLEEVEFQVFSQFGEDGIIQWIINQIQVKSKIFVEFGVEDYFESNTRFLLNNNNWSGLVIDSDKEKIDRLRNSRYFWKFDLTAIDAFITKDNINDLIKNKGKVEGEIGILSVDIDGNDYWVLNALNVIDPQIVICEYNNVFGSEKRVTVPYHECFDRMSAHYSNLYFGASLLSFRYMLENKGYIYLGTNSAGNNAFFVKKTDFPIDKIPFRRENFVTAKFRESRDKDGKLNYLNGFERLNEIKHLPLIDLEAMGQYSISEIYGL